MNKIKLLNSAHGFGAHAWITSLHDSQLQYILTIHVADIAVIFLSWDGPACD